MSRLTFARSAGAAGPKMTDVRYIYIYIYRQTGGALNSQGGTRSRSPQLADKENMFVLIDIESKLLGVVMHI